MCKVLEKTREKDEGKTLIHTTQPSMAGGPKTQQLSLKTWKLGSDSVNLRSSTKRLPNKR